MSIPVTTNYRRNIASSLLIQRGEVLGALIDELVEDKAMGDTTKEDVQAAAGSAAGITASTLKQIANGSVVCPPRNRLQDLADYFGVSMSRLVAAAERDGCDYSE